MDMTNLHFHGLTVSPDAQQDDVLDMIATREIVELYRPNSKRPPPRIVVVPHASSWESLQQVLDGMSGALVIEGIETYFPPVSGLPERVLVVRGRSLRIAIVPLLRLSGFKTPDLTAERKSASSVVVTFREDKKAI